uniref:Putative secreted protein n=1 Tax=Ixodes ricinus TaxID=34613 RepID=A0A6B0TZQ8_IXORI
MWQTPLFLHQLYLMHLVQTKMMPAMTENIQPRAEPNGCRYGKPVKGKGQDCKCLHFYMPFLRIKPKAILILLFLFLCRPISS